MLLTLFACSRLTCAPVRGVFSSIRLYTCKHEVITTRSPGVPSPVRTNHASSYRHRCSTLPLSTNPATMSLFVLQMAILSFQEHPINGVVQWAAFWDWLFFPPTRLLLRAIFILSVVGSLWLLLAFKSVVVHDWLFTRWSTWGCFQYSAVLNKTNVDVSVEVWCVNTRLSGVDAQEAKNVSARFSYQNSRFPFHSVLMPSHLIKFHSLLRRFTSTTVS